MQPNIVLCGFMGTGKSAIGRLIASRLGMRFVDMDDLIVQREHRPISDIFRDSGEPYFRKLERNLVRELAGQSCLVISTGGGVVLNPDNISDFTKTGMVVCLTAEPEAIFERIKNDSTRPLLAVADPLARIRELLAIRKPYYDAIAIRVDTTFQSPQQAAEHIIGLYRRHTGQSP